MKKISADASISGNASPVTVPFTAYLAAKGFLEDLLAELGDEVIEARGGSCSPRARPAPQPGLKTHGKRPSSCPSNPSETAHASSPPSSGTGICIPRKTIAGPPSSRRNSPTSPKSRVISAKPRPRPRSAHGHCGSPTSSSLRPGARRRSPTAWCSSMKTEIDPPSRAYLQTLGILHPAAQTPRPQANAVP